MSTETREKDNLLDLFQGLPRTLKKASETEGGPYLNGVLVLKTQKNTQYKEI